MYTTIDLLSKSLNENQIRGRLGLDYSDIVELKHVHMPVLLHGRKGEMHYYLLKNPDNYPGAQADTLSDMKSIVAVSPELEPWIEELISETDEHDGSFIGRTNNYKNDIYPYWWLVSHTLIPCLSESNTSSIVQLKSDEDLTID